MYAHRVRPVIRVFNVCSENLTCTVSLTRVKSGFRVCSKTIVHSYFNVCIETSASVLSYFQICLESLTCNKSVQCMLTELDL